MNMYIYIYMYNIICVCVYSIKIGPLNYCCLQAAMIQRFDFDCQARRCAALFNFDIIQPRYHSTSVLFNLNIIRPRYYQIPALFNLCIVLAKRANVLWWAF